MYLKSIEIQGFKSFANKTVLDFSSGITAIVGPNGSGKSNIADAVRWVLGEQKVKQLRGASMQDVIFAGTQARKAQGFAFVAITLDNSDHSLALDYDEVVVSRRLYRSGESEYMLNGTQCRLKDVQELFYDTGIGKEGYSIIGQGQIDKILSGRPEERRELFDEAVGIVKYKRRKLLAEKKLEEERQNLTRVSDILSELTRQLGPLQRQSDNARQFLQLRDELLVLDANLFVRELQQTLAQYDESSGREQLTMDDLQGSRAQSEQLRLSYEQAESRLQQAEAQLAEYRSAKSQAQLQRSTLEGRINVLREQISAEGNNRLHFNRRSQSIDGELARRLSSMEEQLRALLSIREQMNFLSESQGADGELDAESFALDQGLIEASLKEAVLAVRQYVRADYHFREDMSEEREKLMRNRLSFQENIEEKKQQLARLDERGYELQRMLDSDEQLVRELQQKQQSLNQALSRSQEAYHAAATRLESIRNLAERYEGYGHAVRSVMDMKKHNAGIHGVVAELMEVPRGYETAIETALGGSLQHIVTEDEHCARQLIEHLKRQRLGRATFLPLSTIVGREDAQYRQAAGEQGALGVASELIHYDERYRAVFRQLLGRCLLVQDMEQALRIQKKYRQSLRIVTLEGELLSPGGSISGGAYKNSSNLVGRKRELEELEEKCAQLKSRMEALKQEQTDGINRRDLAGAAMEAHRLELNQLALERKSRALGLQSELQVEYASLSARMDYVTESIRRLAEEMAQMHEEKQGLSAQLEDSDRQRAEKEAAIVQLETEIEQTSREAQAKEAQLGELEQQRTELTEARRSLMQEKDALSERILLLEKDLLRIQNQREKHEQKIDSLSAYMFEEYHMTYQAALERYSEALGELSELRSRIAALKADIKKLGPVNIEAIEEFKEVSERHRFLDGQYQDLIQSEEHLRGIIQELDQGMRRQFEENFQVIRQEFDRVFKKLFGGGQGRLELQAEEGDVLEAQISIVAEPPGKKLQNMMQLSGGEKALTAIALLFAIQSLKPSPFCLLDEIEAALDDSNVGRFADYLHNLTARTQFILITHRRGTMEKADRLFGVTMQEKGVTALVSVDLVAEELNG